MKKPLRTDPVYTPFADLESRLETALAALYAALEDIAETGAIEPAIMTGWGASVEISDPTISIVCRESDAERAGLGMTGNHTITAAITARTNAKDSAGTVHVELEAYMRSILFTSNLAALVTTEATDLTVMHASPTHFSRSTAGNWRISTQLVEFYVAGATPT